MDESKKDFWDSFGQSKDLDGRHDKSDGREGGGKGKNQSGATAAGTGTTETVRKGRGGGGESAGAKEDSWEEAEW